MGGIGLPRRKESQLLISEINKVWQLKELILEGIFTCFMSLDEDNNKVSVYVFLEDGWRTGLHWSELSN